MSHDRGVEPAPSSFPRRVRRGDTVLGIFVKLASTESVDVAARAGFDFCVLDAEHSQLGPADLLRLVRHAAAIGFPPVVRLPELDAGTVNRVLESGAQGVQLSGLRSATDAGSLRSCMRYPPEGTRSVSLAQPAAAYGARPLADYLASTAADPALVVGQVESATTDDPLDEVVSALDVVFVGTTDLSVDLGFPGDLHHRAVVARMGEIAEAASATGARLGAWASTAEQAHELRPLAATYLVVGSDLQVLQQGTAALVSAFRRRSEGAKGVAAPRARTRSPEPS